MFRPYFPNRILFFSFSKADYNVLCFRVVLICIEFGQKILLEMQEVFCKGFLFFVVVVVVVFVVVVVVKTRGPCLRISGKKATR